MGCITTPVFQIFMFFSRQPFKSPNTRFLWRVYFENLVNACLPPKRDILQILAVEDNRTVTFLNQIF